MPGAVEGEPCDPSDQEGFRYAARITFQGAEALGAKWLSLRLVPEGEALIHAGVVEPTADAVAMLEDTLRPSWGKVKVLVVAQSDDVSACDPATDSAWQLELAWDGRPAGDRVEATLKLVAPDPVACVVWNAE